MAMERKLKKSTTIKLDGTVERTNKHNLSVCLSLAGCNVRKMSHRVKYWDGFNVPIDEDTYKCLVRYGHDDMKVIHEWETSYLIYSGGCLIRDYFGVDGDVEFYDYAIEVKTENKNLPQHRKEVRKIYTQLKTIYPDIMHSCTKEETWEETCGN